LGACKTFSGGSSAIQNLIKGRTSARFAGGVPLKIGRYTTAGVSVNFSTCESCRIATGETGKCITRWNYDRGSAAVAVAIGVPGKSGDIASATVVAGANNLR
jgi:hypothetical protein